MTVRVAKFVDIPRIVGLMADAHGRSVYRHCTFDTEEAKQFVARSMQRHGHQNYGGCFVLVAETADTVEGFIIGFIDQVYPAVGAFYVTDLLFITSESADPHDAVGMVNGVKEWAQSNPMVVKMRLGITDAIGDWRRTAQFYERMGGEQSGAMYEWRFER